MGTQTARLAAPDRAGPRLSKYLSFSLTGQQYALPIEQVREIIEMRPLTALPLMPLTMRGVLNLRGAAVPVLDLARRLGRESTEVGRRSCIIIIETQARARLAAAVLGVVVDTVTAVRDIPADAVEPPPAMGMHAGNEFVRGMARSTSDFVVLIDLQHSFSETELRELASLPEPDRAVHHEEAA